MQQWFELN